jgi:hypothetical protein
VSTIALGPAATNIGAGLASGVRVELRLLLRGLVLPVCLVICALFAIGNVINQANAVHSDYALVQHTRAEYRANGMDFPADLAKPATVVTNGDEQTINNLARYDYDTMASAVIALSPASTVDEVLKYFGFIFFPVLFFLLGLWMSTVQRRYHLEKVTLVRFGCVRTVAARQLALLVAAAIVVVVVLCVDSLSRIVATGIVSSELPLRSYPPLSAAPATDPLAQWGVVLLVVLFFGGAGVAVGAAFGVFAVPAILFLIWDLVVPFLGPDDPRNWFVVLGHSVFNFGSGFQLAGALPVVEPIPLIGVVGGAAVLLVLGYVCIRIRSPLAT